MRSLALIAALVVGLALALPVHCLAATSLTTRNGVVWGNAFLFGDFEDQGASGSDADGYSETGGSFAGTAMSFVSFGAIHARAQADVVSGNYDRQIANSSARFKDTFLFTGGSGVGQAVFTFTVSGSVNPLSADADGSLFVNEGEFANFKTGGTYSSFPIDFLFGSPIELTFGLGAVVRFLGMGSTNSATADFGSTATLTGIQVYQGGDSVPFELSAESGTVYPLTVVPEPVAALFALLALPALALRRRR
ncbi:MAG: hypothetical protein WD738_09680 [Pirellulales bacterium]